MSKGLLLSKNTIFLTKQSVAECFIDFSASLSFALDSVYGALMNLTKYPEGFLSVIFLLILVLVLIHVDKLYNCLFFIENAAKKFLFENGWEKYFSRTTVRV